MGTVAIYQLLSQVESRIVKEIGTLKNKHAEREKEITAQYKNDLALSQEKVNQKQQVFNNATTQFEAAKAVQEEMSKKLARAEGALAMARSEKQEADDRAKNDRDLDVKSNQNERDETLKLVQNERNLISTIKSLLGQLNGGRKTPIATTQTQLSPPGNASKTEVADTSVESGTPVDA